MELMHYGTKRHSGRYPWGSGENPYQHDNNFLNRVKELQDKGMSETEIAKAFGMNTAELRRRKSAAKDAIRTADSATARKLYNEGKGYSEIGRIMGKNESTIRYLLKEDSEYRASLTSNTVERLKQNVDKYKYIDVGLGVAEELGITETRLKTALQVLKDQGYEVHEIQVAQVGIPGQYTKVKVLAPPGTEYREVSQNRKDIHVIGEPETLADLTKLNPYGLNPVKSISSKRVQIAYAEDGGKDKDGVIELRPGVEGLDLGNARYAQVRIGVDNTHYLKGMAVYADDLPKGIDIRFNTNKSRGIPMISDDPNGKSVLKPMKDDPDNPFGSAIKDGKKGQRGYLNIVREEGDWETWSKTLSSQMLSKQYPELAKRQLTMARQNKEAELADIMSLTNPTVKEHMLKQFADGCDAAAVTLKAAALPRQYSHVILPLTKIKENEIYAPGYRNGEKVVLIRHPHGGTFEIPELTVNNRNVQGKATLGNIRDAVGIHPKVAQQLSGADFDGDTVIVIPNTYKGKKLIKTAAPLEGLADFDPQASYPAYPGMKVISKSYQQKQMGEVSNLITDMTIKGANSDEIARAVRHSMVIIDAEKHKLNYKQSAIDNDIASLKARYQVKPDGRSGGASTIISRAKSELRVNERDKRYIIDENSGEKIPIYTGKTFVNKKGETVYRQTKSTQMAETKDARTLMSAHPTDMERIYAEYANQMKAIANKARKESLSTKPIPYSPSAYKAYSEEVKSLNYKIDLAKRNQPLERKAQIVANSIIRAKKLDNPAMTDEELKKIKTQALSTARARVGKENRSIKVTPKEWEAIQAGAVSKSRLKEIMNYSDQDHLKKMAMPKSPNGISNAKLARAKAMYANGHTQQEIADALGISLTSVKKALS